MEFSQPSPTLRTERDLIRDRTRKLRLFGAVGISVAIVLAIVGIVSRKHDEVILARETNETAIPTVALIKPKVGAASQTLVLPGDVEPWYWAPIYGQVSGYVKAWYKDIGARVKKGDLLAVIDTPELDAHVVQAKALLAKAQADERLAQITAKRWDALWETGSKQHLEPVSRQSTDVTDYNLMAAHAATLAAQGELDRLQALEQFKYLVAPFDGVVTARRTDVGAFVKANAVSAQPEMFEVADTHIMRVYVRVPQMYASQIHVGMKAALHVPGMPGKVFPATVNTTAAAINLASRTLLVELWAPNPLGELYPGTYADVYFKLPARPNAVEIPSSALIFQDHGLQVATIGPNDRVHLKNVTIGWDLGANVIVESGLSPTDKVIDSPPDALNEGDRVRVVGDYGVFPGLESEPQQIAEATR
jgi:membrane fusion protein (multidrug efflux system)